MGDLTRRVNWSASPLGPPENWPQSLRFTVSLILNSRFPMFLWWGPDLIQFYNDAYRPSFGNNGKHPLALGQKGIECWPEIWPTIKPLIDNVLIDGKATWSEDQLIPIYRNGKVEDVYWTFGYSPVNDESGNPSGVLVICNETTDKVKNYNRLLESRQQLAFAIDAAELATWDFNPITNEFTANERYTEWFGISAASKTNNDLALSVIAEEDRQRVIDAYKLALAYNSGCKYDIEYTIRPQGLPERVLRAKGKAWFNTDKIAYRFTGTLQDVTEQVNASRKMEEAEERARMAVESAELGTFEVNLKTNAINASPRMSAIFDLEPGSDRSKYLNPIFEDDLPIRNAAYQKAYETGLLDYDGRIRWKDGSIHWIRVKGRMYFDEANVAVRLLGIVQDITEQKEIDRRKDEFISIVSHELKTPLTTIKAYSHDQVAAGMIGKMGDQLRRLEYIIQDLLDVTRIEGDKIRFRQDEFDMGDLVEQSVEEVQRISHKHQIKIEKLQHVPIVADRERISQVVINLLTNAVRYSPGRDQVIVSLTKHGSEVICAVKDFGMGIPAEKHEKIFERFYQASNINRFNAGLGLGLYISAHIIKRQQGRIWVESVPGEGSTFFFTLRLDVDLLPED